MIGANKGPVLKTSRRILQDLVEQKVNCLPITERVKKVCWNHYSKDSAIHLSYNRPEVENVPMDRLHCGQNFEKS